MTRSLREKILIISPMVPRPDMNSRDLRLFSILEILAKEYEITFVSTNRRPGDEFRYHGPNICLWGTALLIKRRTIEKIF